MEKQQQQTTWRRLLSLLLTCFQQTCWLKGKYNIFLNISTSYFGVTLNFKSPNWNNITPKKKSRAVWFHGWFQTPKATRAGSGGRRSGDLSSAPQCCCRVPSGFPSVVGVGGVGPVGGLGYGLTPFRVKIPRGYRLKRCFFYQTKSWKVSGVNFCWSDVRFRDSPSQKWIERAEAEVKILSWSYFSLVLGGRVNYVKTCCFCTSMNSLGLWGSRGHHYWMWCGLKKNLQLAEAQIVGLQCACLHVHNMKGCDGFKLLQNIYIYIPHKGLETPKVCCFQDFQNLSFPPKNARKFQEDPYARIFQPQGRGMRNLEMEGGSGQEIASGLGLAPAVLLGKTRVRPQDGHQLQLWWICKKPLVDEARLLP